MKQLPVMKGLDTAVKIQVLNHGEVINFRYATRMSVSFYGTTTVADSGVDAGLFDWSRGDGVIVFRFGGLPLFGSRMFTLTVYDSRHPGGQVVVHPRAHNVTFKFM